MAKKLREILGKNAAKPRASNSIFRDLIKMVADARAELVIHFDSADNVARTVAED
jgi:hypothetical protein